MSRTDKDKPYWVRAEWWEPDHDRCEHAQKSRYRIRDSRTERACDLPAEPVVSKPNPFVNRGCKWRAVWDRHHYPHPPHWYINTVWNAPERAAARVDCLNAGKEYRASGEVDTVPTTRQARHCAAWLWY